MFVCSQNNYIIVRISMALFTFVVYNHIPDGVDILSR